MLAGHTIDRLVAVHSDDFSQVYFVAADATAWRVG